jgi:hypothetical protein
MVYLRTISVVQKIHCRIQNLLIHDELENLWYEVVVVYIEGILQYLSGGTRENRRKLCGY